MRHEKGGISNMKDDGNGMSVIAPLEPGAAYGECAEGKCESCGWLETETQSQQQALDLQGQQPIRDFTELLPRFCPT